MESNKKVGIITFHWADNYGAILQAYALQQTLKNNGYSPTIINYLPERLGFVGGLKMFIKHGMPWLSKRNGLKRFRSKNLLLTKPFGNKTELVTGSWDEYDGMICGSDQIWNEYLGMNGFDGNGDDSYFLSWFEGKRVAYAASFGTPSIGEKYTHRISGLLSGFERIGVREDTAKEIVSSAGCESKVVCDPTVLAGREVFEHMVRTDKQSDCLAVYMLHSEKNQVDALAEGILEAHSIGKKVDITNLSSIESWITDIATSRCLLTNSYHGTVFALLFHTPFYVLFTSGINMNDRFLTLLKRLDLLDRVVKPGDNISETEIDWPSVDEKMKRFRNESESFLFDALGA